MVTTAMTKPEQPSRSLIAPLWHTLVILLVLLGLSASSARSQSLAGVSGRGHVASYLTVMVVEWLVVGFVWFGLRRRGVRLPDLIGGAWPNGRAVLVDLGLAVLFLFASNVVLGLLGHMLKAAPNQAIRNIFPQGLTESVVYLLLTLTAGICEELIFRGYLYKQFAAITGSLYPWRGCTATNPAAWNFPSSSGCPKSGRCLGMSRAAAASQ